MPVKAGVIRAGARNTRCGAAETFTGIVFQDPVITAEAPSRLGGSVVTFTPGARTAWHSHHGASPDRLFSHLALSEAGEQGQGTAWGTHVTNSEYNEAASGG